MVKRVTALIGVLLVALVAGLFVALPASADVAGPPETPALSAPVEKVDDPKALGADETTADGKVLHNDKFYSTAEVDRLVKAKAPKGQTAQKYPYEGNDQGFYLQRSSCQYWYSSSTPDVCLRVYYNGFQNMAMMQHTGYFYGVYASTYVQICRANSSFQCYSWTENVGFQSDGPGNWAYHAGPVYSGYSRGTCIWAHGFMEWKAKVWKADLRGFCG